MNIKLFVLGIAFALPWSGVLQAQPIFLGKPITENTLIDANNTYADAGVGLYDAGGGSPTVQIVDGGAVGYSATLFNQSHLIMSDGYIGTVMAILDQATFTMNGGVVGNKISPVVEYAWGIEAHDQGTMHLRGGRLEFNLIGLFGESSLHIYGLGLRLFGEDTSAYTDRYWVTGTFTDGQPIAVNVDKAGPQTSIFLHNVPEPASLSLAAAGSAGLLWRLRCPLNRPRLQRG